MAAQLEGQLTATVHADDSDLDEAGRLLPVLETQGRPDPVQRLAHRGRGRPRDGARWPAPRDLRLAHHVRRARWRSNGSCVPLPTRMFRARCSPPPSPTATPTSCGVASTADSPKPDFPFVKEFPMLDGVLFFPVTPFTASGDVDYDRLAEHVAKGVAAGPRRCLRRLRHRRIPRAGLEEFARVVAHRRRGRRRTGAGVRRGRRLGAAGQGVRRQPRRPRRRRHPAAAAVPGDDAAGRAGASTPARSPTPPTSARSSTTAATPGSTRRPPWRWRSSRPWSGSRTAPAISTRWRRIVRAVTDALAAVAASRSCSSTACPPPR